MKVLSLLQDCIFNHRQLILLDDIDSLVLSDNRTASISDMYVSSAVLFGLDSLIQKHNNDCNKNNSRHKIFLIATCTDSTHVHPGLFQPYRLGSLRDMLTLPLPSQQQRYLLLYRLLSCDGVRVLWGSIEGKNSEIISSSSNSNSHRSNNDDISNNTGNNNNNNSYIHITVNSYTSRIKDLALELSLGCQVTVNDSNSNSIFIYLLLLMFYLRKHEYV